MGLWCGDILVVGKAYAVGVGSMVTGSQGNGPVRGTLDKMQDSMPSRIEAVDMKAQRLRSRRCLAPVSRRVLSCSLSRLDGTDDERCS